MNINFLYWKYIYKDNLQYLYGIFKNSLNKIKNINKNNYKLNKNNYNTFCYFIYLQSSQHINKYDEYNE